MMKRIPPLILILLAFRYGVGDVRASAPPVSLSISLPRDTYPRDALVRVTTVLRNTSSHPISVIGAVLPVEVHNRYGRLVYPPALRSATASSGGGLPVPHPLVLQPGAKLVTHVPVVLRGRYLYAGTDIAAAGGRLQEVRAPALTVSLTPRERSSLLVLSRTPSLLATFHGPPGPVWYQEVVVCQSRGHQTTVGAGATQWLLTRSRIFRPPCATPASWHLVAGVPDHSVAVLSWRR